MSYIGDVDIACPHVSRLDGDDRTLMPTTIYVYIYINSLEGDREKGLAQHAKGGWTMR